jgi:hypothetical protein
LSTPDQQVPAVIEGQPALLTISDLTHNVQRIHLALKEVMKKDVHYGKIPGTPKMSLWKPGAEVIGAMFRFASYPSVQDLSGADKVHYRVVITLTHVPSGTTVGHGVGECSSDEEKYRWRKAVCPPEWDSEDPARKREVWKRGENNSQYQVKQVRTHPADVANTILKMAKKRAYIDAILTATAASDIFDQDVEDMTPEQRAAIFGEEPGAGGTEQTRPGEKTEGNGKRAAGEPALIAPAALKIIRARLADKKIPDEELCKELKVAALELIPYEGVNDAMQWIVKQPAR